MSEKVLARRYLVAFVNCFSPEDKVKSIKKLKVVLQNVLNDKRVLKALLNPTFSNVNKIELLSRFVSDKEVFLSNFLNLIVERNRTTLFLEILSESDNVIANLSNNIEAKAYSSTKIKKQDEESIVAFLKAYFKKDIELNVFVDESIIAGVRIEAANIEFDATLDNSLNKLKLAFQ